MELLEISWNFKVIFKFPLHQTEAFCGIYELAKYNLTRVISSNSVHNWDPVHKHTSKQNDHIILPLCRDNYPGEPHHVNIAKYYMQLNGNFSHIPY